MILACMVLSLVAAALLGLTGTLVEWAALAYRRAARWGWIAVLLASALLSLAGPVSRRIGTTRGSMPPATSTSDHAGSAAGVVAAIDARVTPMLDAITGAGRGLDTLLTLAWMLSSLGCATSLALAHRRLRRERRGWLRTAFDRDVVLVSEDLGPAVVGFRSPEIVVPAWALDMDAESRRLIACHEREHLAAGDQRLVLVGLFAVVLAPWNPLLWWQLRRLRLAIEIDCDRRALGAGTEMRAYGNLLITLGRRSIPLPAPAAPLAEGGSALVRRVRALTRSAPRWRALRASVAVTGASLLAGVVAVLPAPPAGAPLPAARQGGVYRATLSARQADDSVTPMRLRGAPPSSTPGHIAGFVSRAPQGGSTIREVRARGVATFQRSDSDAARPSGGTLRPIRATAVRPPHDTLPSKRPD